MAAATVTALAGLGIAGYQAYKGHQAQKQAKKGLQNYNRQDLDTSNPYKDIPISTVGSDLMLEENRINNANAVDALRNGGTRGISMIPKVVASENRANAELRSYLDDQAIKKNYAIAGDQSAIRGMKEDRENADLAGLGQQLQVGRQDMWSGFRGMANSGMYAANNIDWKGTNPQVTGVDSSLKPVGLNPISNSEFRLQNYSNVLRNYNKI